VAAYTVGLLHPGEMGAALGGLLRATDVPVLWASDGRSAESARRAAEAGLEDVGSLESLVARCDVLLSVCPPHAALDVARSVAGFDGVFVDANAIAPETARAVAGTLGGPCVDGGIVGPPPRSLGTTRLYLSGADARGVADLFAGTVLETSVVSDEVGAASAVKVAYAAWTKGTAALLLAVESFARAEDVSETLHAEWRRSLPDLSERSARASRSAAAKGWRWVGEMEEIAAAFSAVDLPAGFHQAAAEVFRSVSTELRHEWPHGVQS
jgi:3-hydroxyisobutyrate dehydrogenase-like beta-hydroxyacid dehydrogenase